MFISIINDCRDQNALSRQSIRTATLLGSSPICLGIRSDLEAAGNLIDLLDASQGKKGIILVNVAPRHGSAKRWPNGTPFGMFFFHETLVVTSLDGRTLSLAKKFDLLSEVKEFDIPTVVDWAVQQHLLTTSEADYITHTQFRSFEFLPRVAQWIWNGLSVPVASYDVKNISSEVSGAWYTDCFGNIKTTFLSHEQKEAQTWLAQPIKFYDRLKDVPNQEAAFIVGSSGLGNQRFLEVVVQGGSAAEKFELR